MTEATPVRERDVAKNRRRRVALLLSCTAFEVFYENVMGLDKQSYLATYRNDFSWDYAAGLRMEGIDTYLYVPSLRHNGLHHTEDGFSVRFLPLHPIFRSWHRHPLLSRSPLGRYSTEIVNTLSFRHDLCEGLAEDAIDALYIQEYWTARYDVLALTLKLPILAGDHGGTARRQVTALKKWTFPRAGLLTCQSHAEHAQVSRQGAKAMYLPNGIDTNAFRPSDDRYRARADKKLLMVARLTNPQKRVSDVLKAMPRLGANWRLTVAGVGPDDAFLRSLALGLGVSERVRFVGLLPRKEVARAYAECDVFVLPSAWEGKPLACLEAMACGCPVVVSDIPAFTDLVLNGENGIKVPVGDPEKLAVGIEQAFEARAILGPAARRTIVDSFSATVFFKELATQIRELVQRG